MSDMEIKKDLEIKGDKILLVGFWGFKNMGDELILLGNIKLLQKQGKKIFVISQDNTRLKTFLSKEIDCSDITFVDELPRGIKSSIRYLKKNGLKQLKLFFQIDTVILGGGEILTEESSHSYHYRFRSIWPSLFFKKNLYIMGGVQIPKKKLNKKLFNFTLKKTSKIFCRDFDGVEELKSYGFGNVEFLMDTSYFVRDDWEKYKKDSNKKYIIININSKGKQFIDDLKVETKKYVDQGYDCYFVPVCTGWTDDDNRFFDGLKKDFPNIKICKRDDDFEKFLQFLGGAKCVISSRLHLYLVSEYIGLKTVNFPYQKKILKMQKVIEKIK